MADDDETPGTPAGDRAEQDRRAADTDPAGIPVAEIRAASERDAGPDTEPGVEPGAEPDAEPDAEPAPHHAAGRRGLWPPGRGQVLVAALLAVLGFAVVVQ